MIDNKLAILNEQKAYITLCNSIPVCQRIEILKRLRELIQSNEEKIKQALFEDLHKNPTEAYMTEIGITLSEISYCIKHIKSWSKTRRKPSSVLLFPSKAFVYPQAKGKYSNNFSLELPFPIKHSAFGWSNIGRQYSNSFTLFSICCN
jgi:acyl-CoA reductase-like NAD-dependent aldehyde dehydrogenase